MRRYRTYEKCAGLYEHKGGEYVLYTEAHARIEALEADRKYWRDRVLIIMDNNARGHQSDCPCFWCKSLAEARILDEIK